MYISLNEIILRYIATCIHETHTHVLFQLYVAKKYLRVNAEDSSWNNEIDMTAHESKKKK